MMTKALIVLSVLVSSMNAFAGPNCFKDVKDYYTASDAGKACNNVDDVCFNSLRAENGPMVSAQNCKAVSVSCMREIAKYSVTIMAAAQSCAQIDEDCYNFMRDKFNGPVQTAQACSLN